MLTIADRTYTSHLILGTGFPTLDLLETAISATGAQLVTVALRRVDAVGRTWTNVPDSNDQPTALVLNSTAGADTAGRSRPGTGDARAGDRGSGGSAGKCHRRPAL